MKSYKTGKILENIEIAPNIYKMVVDAKLGGKPGQFFMFRADSFRNEPLLSRPFGVCDENDHSTTLLYQVVGEGTKIMAGLKKDAEVKLLGPLGNGFRINDTKGKKIAVVAGGIGIAPLLYLAKNLEEKADFFAGFTGDPYFTEDFKAYSKSITYTSFEKEGKFITEVFDPNDYDIIFACGPNPMLKAIHDMNERAEIQISMEAHMACGIGACLGCTVQSVDGDFIRVCKDGPVFDSREVFEWI